MAYFWTPDLPMDQKRVNIMGLILWIVFLAASGIFALTQTSYDCSVQQKNAVALALVESEYELKQVYDAMQHPEIKGYFGSGDIYLFTHSATSNQFFIVAVGNGVAMFPVTHPIPK